MERKLVDPDDLVARCLGCDKDVTDETPYADFPICKDCYAKKIGEFLDESERYPLNGEDAVKRAEKHVEIVGKFQEKLIQSMG